MTSRSALRSWFFSGLTVNERLQQMGRQGLAVLPNSNPDAVQQVFPLEDFSSSTRELAMHAYPVYLAFFCLENAVRELIVERMTEKFGSEWWSTAVSAKIKGNVTKRRESEEKNRWHTQRGASEIFYTDFGDLLSIIQNNWTQFEDLFPDQNWISSRLNEIEQSRNIIAHNNVLDQREVSRIRMYLEDWIRQVG